MGVAGRRLACPRTGRGFGATNPGATAKATATTQATALAVALVAAGAATFTFFRTLVDQARN